MAVESPQRTLDVRQIAGEPFGHVVDALADLSSGESLVLVNSFEPAPLYAVRDDQGYAYETESTF